MRTIFKALCALIIAISVSSVVYADINVTGTSKAPVPDTTVTVKVIDTDNAAIGGATVALQKFNGSEIYNIDQSKITGKDGKATFNLYKKRKSDYLYVIWDYTFLASKIEYFGSTKKFTYISGSKPYGTRDNPFVMKLAKSHTK